jgi:hypothetical protein
MFHRRGRMQVLEQTRCEGSSGSRRFSARSQRWGSQDFSTDQACRSTQAPGCRQYWRGGHAGHSAANDAGPSTRRSGTQTSVCRGRDIAGLISKNPFDGQALRRDVVRFVSVLSQRPRLTPSTPMRFPPTGHWLMKILTRRNRLVIGMYRRHMKVIGLLGALDRLYGVSVTTRNWNTIAAIARVLRNDRSD